MHSRLTTSARLYARPRRLPSRARTLAAAHGDLQQRTDACSSARTLAAAHTGVQSRRRRRRSFITGREAARMAPTAAPAQTTRLMDLVLDFLAYLELERGLSRNTLEAYRSDLQQYGEFLDRRGVDALAAGPADLAAFVSELRRGRGRASARRLRDAAAQGGLPALVLPPPAPRADCSTHDPTAELRGPRRRPRLPNVLSRDRGPSRCSAQPRGDSPGGAARPRAAGDDVRVRPARVGGDRPRAVRARPRGGHAASARQGLQGAPRADRQQGDRRRSRPTSARPSPARRGCATSRTCSSTCAAAGLSRQGLYKIVQRHARSRRARPAG